MSTFCFENEDNLAFVVSPIPPDIQDSRSLMKCTPSFNKTYFDPEDRARKRAGDHTKYFAFWDKVDEKREHTLQTTQVKEHCVKHGHTFPIWLEPYDNLEFRVADYRGTDLYELLVKQGMKISLEHSIRLVKHLAEGLLVLNKLGIVHYDVALRNILVSLSDKERKDQLLISSLPVLIDFEFIDDDPTHNHQGLQAIQWSTFMKTCPLCKFDVNILHCWLEHYITEDTKKSFLIEMLTKEYRTMQHVVDAMHAFSLI